MTTIVRFVVRPLKMAKKILALAVMPAGGGFIVTMQALKFHLTKKHGMFQLKNREKETPCKQLYLLFTITFRH